jgi:ankyrin repeat protein
VEVECEPIVEYLIRKGVNVNTGQVRPGLTALQLAASNASISIFSLLLSAGAAINAVGDYGTALHLAAAQGHLEVVSTLLSAGADIDLMARHSTRRSGTPLHAAAFEGRRDVVELLIAKGADVKVLGSMQQH